MAVTHIASSASALSWMAAEWLACGRPSLLGLCSELVAGLAIITPAAGYVPPGSAVLLWITSLCVRLRVDETAESDGLDIGQHAERLET